MERNLPPANSECINTCIVLTSFMYPAAAAESTEVHALW